jgi:hypothetical protein
MPQLPDELHDVIADYAMPLPPSMREAFVAQVVARLHSFPLAANVTRRTF